ncbi:GBS Bsp-like repeat protein [Paenibacillus konkukensis]|uniref:GBS Bsp-like repeat protein n=1 Tax=Paenibacillus konkukensis TaxID=2020716 RepID=A0ABY4RP93_9BACL|nr:GBS Bsp-like repeat-containing protein [Paenibacillus konkukensis]UQZ84030.1 GBS Bsp-like repeat protein [Paenibacillus konkukensis]
MGGNRYGLYLDNTNKGGGYIYFQGRANSNPPQLVIDYTLPNNAPNAPSLGFSDGQVLNTRTPTITWTFSDPDGNAQGGYFVEVINGAYSASLWNSGWINDANARSYTLPSGAIPTDGQIYIRMRVKDSNGAINTNNGNGPDTSFGNRRLIIDTTAPIVSSISTEKTPVSVPANGTFRMWARGVSDNVSGVSSVKFPTRLTGQSTWVWVDGVKSGSDWYCDYPISNFSNVETTYVTNVYAYDAAGNNAMVGEIRTVVDRTPPTFTVDGTSYKSVQPGGTFRVSAYSLADNLAGIQNVRFAVWTEVNGQDDLVWYDGANAGGGTWYKDVPISEHGNAEGHYITHVYAYDNAGNNSSKGVDTYVDRTAPTISSVQGYGYTNQTTGTRRVWFYGVTDGISGIGTTYASYNKPGGGNSGLTAYASGSDYYVDVPLGPEGEYTVYFQAVDRANNASTTVNSKFFVDSQRANDPKPSVVWGTTTAAFTWFPFNDPTPSSGLDRTVLHVDRWTGSEWVFDVDINNDGSPDLWYILPDKNQVEHTVTTLTPGTRYRYTVKHFDMAQNESAYSYYEFVTKKKIGEYRIAGKNGTVSLPVYDPSSGVLGSKALRVGLSSGIGCFELVSISDTNASPVRVQTPQGARSISK